MKWIVSLAVLLIVTGCASSSPKQQPQAVEKLKVVTVQKEFPPQVWSNHKVLTISKFECAKKGVEILSSLGYTHIVKSSHGQYVYGNYSSSRVAVKCLSVEGQTFMYTVVAGAEVDVVERLRNEIMWQF